MSQVVTCMRGDDIFIQLLEYCLTHQDILHHLTNIDGLTPSFSVPKTANDILVPKEDV